MVEVISMSTEMKLIMENWRRNVLNEEATTAKAFLDKIKIGLLVLSAKAAGAEALSQLKDELAPEVLGAGLEMVKTIPAVGNAISGLTAFWKSGKAAVKTILAAKEMSQAAFNVMKVAAVDYVQMEDGKVSDGNPLAKLFNIDDKMEIPLKPEVLTNFAGSLLATLRQDPDMVIQDTDTFAEEKLAMYIVAKGYMADAKAPRG
jgi:hypothetical protein